MLFLEIGAHSPLQSKETKQLNEWFKEAENVVRLVQWVVIRETDVRENDSYNFRGHQRHFSQECTHT